MTNQPFQASSIRGAVDLSALKNRSAGAAGAGAPGGGAPAGMPGGGAGYSPTDIVTRVGDADLQGAVSASIRQPIVLVIYSGRLAESVSFADEMAQLVPTYGGRLQLALADVDANPGILQAFQLQAVPVSFGLIQGQPVPLFEGRQDLAVVRQVLDQLLELAVKNGVAGRLAAPGGDAVAGADGADAADAEEAPLDPLLEQAYDALEANDLEGAATFFEHYLLANPTDEEARVGLAQVSLMKRTAGADLNQARAAAAANPEDVPAQILVADFDVLGGHVEDAFLRLVDTVRATAGDDRAAAREHLLTLFEVVGPADPRVVAGRKALTMALF